jgi:hypothetical protein
MDHRRLIPQGEEFEFHIINESQSGTARVSVFARTPNYGRTFARECDDRQQ